MIIYIIIDIYIIISIYKYLYINKIGILLGRREPTTTP